MSILGYFFGWKKLFFAQKHDFLLKKSENFWFFAPKRGSKKRSNPDGFLFANLNFWRFFFSTLIWLLKNCRGGSDPVRDACTLRRNHVFPGHDFRFLPRRIWRPDRHLYPSQKSPFFRTDGHRTNIWIPRLPDGNKRFAQKSQNYPCRITCEFWKPLWLYAHQSLYMTSETFWVERYTDLIVH